MTVDVRSASVFLFVPGDRPDRFGKRRRPAPTPSCSTSRTPSPRP